MKYNITGLGIDVSEKSKALIEKKLDRLDKLFTPDTVVNVTLSTRKGDLNVEITIPVKGTLIRSEESAVDLASALDLAAAVIERQIKRHRTRLIDKVQSAESFSSLFDSGETEEPDEEDIRIERVKHFSLKPMDPVEACLQMDLLGHSFFVFEDSETGDTSVVYKRKNNSYGLISPER